MQLPIFTDTENVVRISDVILSEIWYGLYQTYFPECTELSSYTINWSNRAQKRTLASCNILRKRVVVARELNYEKYAIWLSPLIYHEMCHAYIGEPEIKNGRRRWHNATFHALEDRHPRMKIFSDWVHQGGWEQAVRSDRAKRAWQKRRVKC